MHANSRQVTSNQSHLHPRLADIVRKHLANELHKPVAEHNARAYQTLCETMARDGRPLILDSFCGTGHSTVQIAQRFPDHLVVGIDKSADRLSRQPEGDGILLQAECEDIWALLLQDGISVDHHFLFYPNPWPKSKHLKRRVHGHPAFRWLLQLGGCIELRSNWQVYVEEFAVAMHLGGRRGLVQRVPDDAPAVTLFERKYRDSGHALWRFATHRQP